MATTNRLLQDFISFSTDVDPGSGGLTLSAPGLTDLLEVADPDFIALTLDPEEVFGSPEIVWVSAHTSAATTATIVRAREGTSARAHDIGTKVIVPITTAGLVHDQLAGLGDDDHPQYLFADGTRDVAGNLLADANVTRDLGASGTAWRNAYLERIFNDSGVEGINFDDMQLAGEWEVSGDFLPDTDLGFNLGNATQSWDELYVSDIHDPDGVEVISIDDAHLIGPWAVSGDFNPGDDVTRDLGSASFTWQQLYVDAILDRGGATKVNIQGSQLQGAWQVVGNLDPEADLVRDLGDASRTWRRLYVEDIYDRNGALVINVDAQVLDNGTWQVDGALVPQDNATHDLGSTALRWNKGYFEELRNSANQLVVDFEPARRFFTDIGSNATLAIEVGDSDVGFYNGFANALNVRGGTKAWRFSGNGAFFAPDVNLQSSCGGSGNRWTSVWAALGEFHDSDLRAKKNVRPMKYGLKEVLAIEPIEFEWKESMPYGEGNRLGWAAQRVLPIIPEAIVVPEDSDQMMAMNTDQMVAVLWSAVRELAVR